MLQNSQVSSSLSKLLCCIPRVNDFKEISSVARYKRISALPDVPCILMAQWTLEIKNKAQFNWIDQL